MCCIGRHSRHAVYRIARTMGRPVAPRSEGPRPLICPKQSVLICRQRWDPHGLMFVVGGSVCEPLSRFSLLPHGPSLLARALRHGGWPICRLNAVLKVVAEL